MLPEGRSSRAEMPKLYLSFAGPKVLKRQVVMLTVRISPVVVPQYITLSSSATWCVQTETPFDRGPKEQQAQLSQKAHLHTLDYTLHLAQVAVLWPYLSVPLINLPHT